MRTKLKKLKRIDILQNRRRISQPILVFTEPLGVENMRIQVVHVANPGGFTVLSAGLRYPPKTEA